MNSQLFLDNSFDQIHSYSWYCFVHGKEDDQFGILSTHLSFLLIKIVNDDPYEKVEGEEGAKYDEDDKVQVHVEVDFSDRLVLHLVVESVFIVFAVTQF